MTAALSKTGARRLAEAESAIERGLATFWEVGASLLQIRDERLYRADFDTFEDYCQQRWNMTRRRANQLVEAAQLGTMVPIANERQARALAGLDADEALEVYGEAEAEGNVTAAGLTAARERRNPSGSDQETPCSAAGSGDDERGGSSASSPTPRVALNPTLVLMADLSKLRAEVAKWMAFDRHEQVIESMSQEQRDDYRSFLLSVFNHASATIDHLDAPARLTAVK